MSRTHTHTLEPQPVAFHSQGPLRPVVGGLLLALAFVVVRAWAYHVAGKRQKARTDVLGRVDPNWVEVTKIKRKADQNGKQ